MVIPMIDCRDLLEISSRVRRTPGLLVHEQSVCMLCFGTCLDWWGRDAETLEKRGLARGKEVLAGRWKAARRKMEGERRARLPDCSSTGSLAVGRRARRANPLPLPCRFPATSLPHSIGSATPAPAGSPCHSQLPAKCLHQDCRTLLAAAQAQA